MPKERLTLVPDSTDLEFGHASRAAMRAFALVIAETDKELANRLRDEADACSPALSDFPYCTKYKPSNEV